jgi:hypothetical protein
MHAHALDLGLGGRGALQRAHRHQPLALEADDEIASVLEVNLGNLVEIVVPRTIPGMRARVRKDEIVQVPNRIMICIVVPSQRQHQDPSSEPLASQRPIVQHCGTLALMSADSSAFAPQGSFMEFVNQTFTGQTIRLDFNSFTGCQFVRCVMIFGGHGAFSFVGCTFSEVSWQFTEAAAMTLQTLAGLYHGMGEGGRDIVESLFETIRNSNVPELG